MTPINLSSFSAGMYLLKVNNRNTRIRFEIFSKLTIKTPEQRPSMPKCDFNKVALQLYRYHISAWVGGRRSAVFIVNFEHISHLVLVFVLLTLNM